MANLADLIAQKAALEKQIAEARREARCRRHRTDQVADGRARPDAWPISAASHRHRRRRVSKSRKGRKVPAKYRDPATGTSWSGRGLQPKWLKAALANGRKLSDFAV